MLSRSVRGFSLIELMISIVIGMLVVAGATGLIVTINSSNANTLESARLTQELRATLQLISDDLRRARRLNDPYGEIGKGALANAQTPPQKYFGAYDWISSPSAGCIVYTYQGEEYNLGSSDTVDVSSNDVASSTARAVSNDRAIYRQVNNAGVGSVVLADAVSTARTGFAGAAGANVGSTVDPTQNVDCAGKGTLVTLSSNQIDITSLSFTPVSPAVSVDTGIIAITLQGKLRNNGVASGGETYALTRTVTQTVNIRSPKAGG
jgi:prepilin-type N-terminal cleavage/methylation domain-containing protein